MLLFATNFQNDLGTNLPDSRLRLNITGANHQTSITTDGLTTTLTLEPNAPATINGKGFTPSTEVGYTVIDAIVTIPTTANLTFNIFGLDVIDGKLVNGIPFPEDATIQVVVDQDLNCTYYINGVYVDVNSTATFDITATNKGTANTNATIKIKHLVITFQQDATPQQANISLNKMQVQSNSDWSFTGEDFLESIDKSDSITDTPHAVIYKNGGLAILSVENPTALTYIESAGRNEGPTSGTLHVEGQLLVPGTTTQGMYDTVYLNKVSTLELGRL